MEGWGGPTGAAGYCSGDLRSLSVAHLLASSFTKTALSGPICLKKVLVPGKLLSISCHIADVMTSTSCHESANNRFNSNKYQRGNYNLALYAQVITLDEEVGIRSVPTSSLLAVSAAGVRAAAASSRGRRARRGLDNGLIGRRRWGISRRGVPTTTSTTSRRRHVRRVCFVQDWPLSSVCSLCLGCASF